MAELPGLETTVRRTPRPGAVRAAALAFAFLAVACAGRDQHAAADAEGRYDAAQATRQFTAAYRDVADIYIEKVAVSELALAGLEGLESVEPALDVQRWENSLSVVVGGTGAGTFARPAAADAEAWGRLTAAAVTAGRQRSRELRTAGAEAIYEAVLEAMLERLDHFSRYAGAAEAREDRASREGFGGIGIRFQPAAEGVEVVGVMAGTPAERAGLRTGDVITRIDGEPAAGLGRREAAERLRGRVDTPVELTLARAAGPVAVAVRRAHIVPETVVYRREGDAAYLRVSGFNQKTASSLAAALERARAELGADLAGIVLDLRGNPGGLLDQAVEVADLFVTGGRIVSTHGRHPDSHQYFDAEPDDAAGAAPLAVLIDAGSASASEIVAAALQDAGRAVVVGATSYGKGTVQTVLRLPNDGELTLTWARFHAPSGYALSRRGVLPDLCTSGALDERDEVLEALRGGRLPLDGDTVAAAAAAGEVGAAVRERCPQRRGRAPVDLEVALAVLDDPRLYRLAAGAAEQRLAVGGRGVGRASAQASACGQGPSDRATPPASC